VRAKQCAGGSGPQAEKWPGDSSGGHDPASAPDHRSKLLIPEASLDDLALLHCEWALGLDRFAALRDARLAAGVPPVTRPADLLGEHGNRWLFRCSLPTEHGTCTSAVRLSTVGGDVFVEHLVVDERPRSEPSADSPETTRVLVELPGVRPSMLRGGRPLVLGEREVPALVEDALEAQREVPIVLVSVDNATREPLVDPQELARRLAGMARIAWLSTVSASRRLKDELMVRGFSEKFGCFHGGVRILWPGLQLGDDPYDHLLLLPVRLYPIPNRVRTEHVAGTICEMIAEDEDLRARLREVEAPRPDPPRPPALPPVGRWTPRLSAAQIVSARSVLARATASSAPQRPPPTLDTREHAEPATPEPTTPLAAEAQPSVGDPDAAVLPEQPAVEASTASSNRPAADSMSSPAPAPAEQPATIPATPPVPQEDAVAAPDKLEAAQARSRVTSESTWSRLANDVIAAAELAEELEKDLDAIRGELADVRKAQRRAEQERDEAVEARFTARTVLEAVEFAGACFPDRLVVLPSVHASAGASPFRDPMRIFEVLALLAMFGRHDGELEAALQKVTGAGARWRPRDSAETSGRFGGHRTWAGSDGHRRLFRRHITLGHGVDAQRCAQIYYDVAGDGRIELAWVGEHRPTVSEDT
jgi:hypothetical protein